MGALPDLKAASRTLRECADRAVVWRLTAAGLIAASSGVLAGIAPLALKEIVDGLQANGEAGSNRMTQTTLLAVAYLGCLGVGRLLIELRPPIMSSAEQHLYGRLRRRYYEHLLHLPLAFHLDRRTGALVYHLQQATTGFQIILFHCVNSILPLLVETATVVVVLLAVGQPLLTLVFTATAVAYFAATAWRSPQLGAAAKTASAASVEAQAHLTEGLTNYEAIKCFGAEHTVLAAFERANADVERSWAGLQRQRLGLGLGVTAIFTLSMTTSFALATHAVATGAMTVGGFLLANLYMLQIIRPLELLSSAARDTLQGLAFIRPLMTVLAQQAEHYGPRQANVQHAPAKANESAKARPSDQPKHAPAVRFQNISLTFGGQQPVLDGLNLNVRAGCRTAIVGPSGGGKTSLVRLLLRLREPDGGSIEFNGVDIRSMPLDEVRSQVAVVPQDVVLFNDSIAANISFAHSTATSTEIERAARLSGLHAFIAALPQGYRTVIGERGLKLSGGERQRIAIARAVLRDPVVYVFDEATSMLDGPTERAILENLWNVAAGRTTITIAHRLSTVRDFDHIAVLAGGRIVEEGTHESLCALGGIYAEMWNSQQASTRQIARCE
jgi:ABC-type multidrug transport system fused ATPase/permease subunit